jgi:hypothetical protein
MRFLDHRHATFGRTSLDIWLARRRDLSLITHDNYKTQASMSTAGFDFEFLGSERPQTHALVRAATGIGI